MIGRTIVASEGTGSAGSLKISKGNTILIKFKKGGTSKKMLAISEYEKQRLQKMPLRHLLIKLKNKIKTK